MPLPLLPPAAAAAWLAAGEALACYWHVEETGVCWAAQQAPPLLLRCWLLGSLLRGQRAAAAASSIHRIQHAAASQLRAQAATSLKAKAQGTAPKCHNSQR